MTKQSQNIDKLWNEIRTILPLVGQLDVRRALSAISQIEEKMIGRHCGDLGDKLLQYLSIVNFVQATGSDTASSIEIGTLFGGSCLIKLMAMRDLGVQGEVICIDPMSGYYDKSSDPYSGFPVNADTFFENLRIFGFKKDVVDLRQVKSNEPHAITDLKERFYATLMIDGDHSRQGVRYDWENYKKYVRNGGIVLFDDYADPTWPEITDFVNELTKCLPLGWKELGRLGTTFMITKNGNGKSKDKSRSDERQTIQHREERTFSEIQLLLRLEYPGNKKYTLIDVGAHVGSFAKPFAQKGWRIICFEPEPANYQELCHNFKDFPNVICIRKAISDTSSENTPLYVSSEHWGIHSLKPFHSTHNRTIMVETVRLNEVLNDLDLDQVTVLKIDIEGADFMALKSFDFNTLHPEVVICEFMDERSEPNFGYTHHDLASYMAELGYTAFVSEWTPFVEYGRKGVAAFSPHKFLACKRYPLDKIPAWGNLIFIPESKVEQFERTLSLYLKGLRNSTSRLQQSKSSQNKGSTLSKYRQSILPDEVISDSKELLAQYKDKHRGQRCVIIGNGPSLNEMDLSFLKDEITFGMNRIYLMFDKYNFRPTYYVSVNPLVIEQSVEEILKIQAPKFLALNALPYIQDPRGITFLRSIGRPSFSKDPTNGLWEGYTVTYVAMQLAYFMGFSEVILIGVDHHFTTPGQPNQEVISGGNDPNHFHPDYFGKGTRWNLPDLKNSEIAYRLAKQAFDADGRRIIDATADGKLTIFPKEDYKDLFKRYRKIDLEKKGQLAEINFLNKQGEDQFNKGKIEAAYNTFVKVIERAPNFATAHNNLGVLCYSKGNKDKALSHYQEAARLQPENITFQKNLADFYYVDLGRVEEAMQIYVKVLNANPEDVETLLIIGHICVALEKFDDAKDFYSRILIIEPWNKDAKQFLEKLEKCQLSVTGDRLSSEDIETASKEYLVSAIVSAYNSERFIRGCLEDLGNQTIADRLEIVVVNSGSEHNEDKIIKEFQEKYSNIKYIKTDKRETVYAAWNRGIKAATGKYITNANTDDRHRKDAFEVMINILETQPEMALVYADVIITETENETFENCTPVGYFNWMDWKREDLLNKGCFMGPQPMWRRDVHDEYGYFDDSFVTSGDYEFWLRISQTNTFLHLPVRLGLYLRSPGSIEHLNREKQREENNEIFKMYKESISSGKNIRRIETDSPQISDKKIDDRKEFKLKALNPDIQVSIIMPTSGQQKYIKKCVESIEKYTSQLHEIIFVDNGATKGTRKWLNQSIKENSNYNMTKCPKDAGSARIYNQGIKVSTGENILLLSNDVVVTKGWLDGMLECLQSTPDAGIVGPMSNVSRGTQKVLKTDNVSINQLDKVAESFMTKNRYRRISSNSIDGFCMLFRRDLVEEIGIFDEQFGQGGHEDEDFCLRALMEGRKNIIAGDVYVHQQNKKVFYRNKKYFNVKWNKADAQSPLGKRFLTLTAIEKGCDVYQRGYINNAVEILLEGIGLSPDDKQPYYALAEILLHAKNHKDAIDILNEMPQDEHDIKRLELLGYCKEGMDNDKDAQDYTDRILSINGKFAPALNLKGIMAFKQGDIKSAEDCFNRAIESDPGYGEPYTNLGALLWDSQPEGALNLFEKGFILSPAITDIITNYHSAITASGEFERAGQVFEEVCSLYPNNKIIRYQLIDLLIKQKKNAEAMNQIEEAITLCGVDDGVLSAALKIRDILGPIEIDETKDKKFTVSLCMIVKNEEEYLARCLNSVKPVVDEMIVIDTGSDDRTIEIARAFGAKVYNFKWTGDFAEARNISLSKASGNWTFHLDADEVISSLDYKAFRKVIRQSVTKKVAFLINTRNYTMDVNQVGWTENDGHYEKEELATGWTPSEKVRLFRNESNIRFEYPIHELVEPSLKTAGITVKKYDIPVHHYGKLNKEKSSKKVEVYYQIGRKKLDETGGDAVAIRELAIQAEIIKKHDEAIELWERFIAIEPNVPKAYINMGISYCSLGKYEEVLETAKKAMKLEPDLKEAHYNYALSKLHLGSAGEAVSILEKLLKRLGEYPPAQFLLAAAYCCDGEKEKGVNELKELQKTSIGPGLPIRCHELAKGLVSSHKHDYAIMLLEAAIDSKNSNKDVLELYSNCLEMMNVDSKTGTMGELMNTPLEERFAYQPLS